MNKSDLINWVAKETGVTKKTAQLCLNATLGGIAHSLTKKDKVTLVGFGTFYTLKRKARKARNPRTGSTINVPAKNYPKWRAGTDLKSKIK